MVIMQFLDYHRERFDQGKCSSGTLKQYWQAIRKLTDAFMDLRASLDWKRIIESMPGVENVADDRIPTLEELRRLVEHHDPRTKAIVYTLCSSGMRVGSWEYLKVKHITPKTMAEHLRWKRQKEIDESPHHTSDIVVTADDETKIVAAKVILHGEKKKKRRNTDYLSFITPEAYFAIQKWLDLRRRYGENITGESYVMRKLFRISHVKRADDPFAPDPTPTAPNDIPENFLDDNNSNNNNDDDDALKKTRGRGTDIDAAHPTKMDRDSISSLLARAMYETGLRSTLAEGKTRHEIKSAHFSRKFFKARAQLYMNGLNVEKMMDHRVGLDPNYWRPIENELLADYLKAVPALTINEDKDLTAVIKQQQAVLEKRQEDKEKELEEIKTQLKRREDELTSIRATFEKMVDRIELGQERQERLVAELEESKKRKDQEVDGLRGILAEVQEMREYVLDHLDDKHRDELFTRIQKLSAKERKRLDERKIQHKNEEELINKRRRRRRR